MIVIAARRPATAIARFLPPSETRARLEIVGLPDGAQLGGTVVEYDAGRRRREYRIVGFSAAGVLLDELPFLSRAERRAGSAAL